MRKDFPFLAESTASYALGDVWGRQVLDPKTRQLAAMAAFASSPDLPTPAGLVVTLGLIPDPLPQQLLRASRLPVVAVREIAALLRNGVEYHFTDPGNAGTLLRSAEAAGADAGDREAERGGVEDAAAVARLFDVVTHAVQQFAQAGGVRGQPLPAFGERHAAGIAQHQYGAQLLFQFLDQLADAALGAVQRLGGGGETAVAGEGVESQ